MEQLYDRIANLIESTDVAENMGALRAIDELTEIGFGENATKVSRFAGYMRTVFELKRDPEILVLASRVLGHLARAGGAMTSDEVEFQVQFVVFLPFLSLSRLIVAQLLISFSQMKTAFDWLRVDRVEYRRFAAVLILKVS